MKLIKPNIQYKQQYLEMLSEWGKIEDYRKSSPFTLKFDTSDFPLFLEELEELEINPTSGRVPSSTFWLLENNDKIVATSNLRHSLNEELLQFGGNIGYGTRADMRRMGYATEILRLTLIEAKKINLHKVLVTCDPQNIGSNKTIIKNGGKLENCILHEGRPTNRYWIENY